MRVRIAKCRVQWQMLDSHPHAHYHVFLLLVELQTFIEKL